MEVNLLAPIVVTKKKFARSPEDLVMQKNKQMQYCLLKNV